MPVDHRVLNEIVPFAELDCCVDFLSGSIRVLYVCSNLIRMFVHVYVKLLDKRQQSTVVTHNGSVASP